MTAPKMDCLLKLYGQSGYRASYIEVQKLAYLLKVAGELGFQGLTYRRSNYGPYAYNLSHVLERTKGMMIMVKAAIAPLTASVS